MTTQRQRISIPDDWNGEDWSCYKVYWPDSQQWKALLMGLLTSPMAGRFWDQDTGSVRDAQSVGFAIEDRTIPLVGCDDEDCEDCEKEPVPPLEWIGEFLMTNCSIPYGALRWLDGVLQYRYCGEWYDVEGITPETLAPVPGDSVPDFPTLGTGTACSKVTAWTNTLFAAIDSLFDDILVPEMPNDAVKNVKDLRYDVNWGDADLLLAYAAAANIHTFGLINETEDETIQQTIKCRLVEGVEGGSTGITKDEYEWMISTIVQYLQSIWTIITYPTSHASMVDMYRLVAQSIGAGDTEKTTAGTISAAGDDCDCPQSGDIEYDWDYKYDLLESQNGFFVVATQGTWVSGKGLQSQIGSGAQGQFGFPDHSGGNYAGTINLIEIEFQADSGDVITVTYGYAGVIHTDANTPITVILDENSGWGDGGTQKIETGQIAFEYGAVADQGLRIGLRLENQSTVGWWVRRVRVAGSGDSILNPPIVAYP